MNLLQKIVASLFLFLSIDLSAMNQPSMLDSDSDNENISDDIRNDQRDREIAYQNEIITLIDFELLASRNENVRLNQAIANKDTRFNCFYNEKYLPLGQRNVSQKQIIDEQHQKIISLEKQIVSQDKLLQIIAQDNQISTLRDQISTLKDQIIAKKNRTIANLHRDIFIGTVSLSAAFLVTAYIHSRKK